MGKWALVLLPIALSFLLYPVSDREIFNSSKYQQSEFVIENLFQKKPTIRNLIADIFSAPLYLDWYKVSITNNLKEKDPTCAEGDPPSIFFTFISGDPRIYYSNLKETTVETGGYSDSGPGHPTYYLPGGEKSYFIAPSWEKYSINGGLVFSGDCRISKPFLTSGDFGFMLTSDYSISVKPYWLSWFVGFAIIFIFWLFLLSSVIAMHDWLKKK